MSDTEVLNSCHHQLCGQMLSAFPGGVLEVLWELRLGIDLQDKPWLG